MTSDQFSIWKKDETAQALVESALIFPILVFLLFALFTAGYWMNAQQLVTQAARQGARQGALTNSNGQMMGAIVANMNAFDPDASKTSVTITPSDEADIARKRGNPLSVYVAFVLPFYVEGMPQVFKSVHAKIVVMMECDAPVGKTVCL